jgi:hypothetical protein
MIYKCHASEIVLAWPIVEGWLEKSIAVAPPWWSIEYLRLLCERGDYILWLAMTDKPVGCALTVIEQYPKAKVCSVSWIGGKGLKAWLPELQATIELWAKDAGAAYLTGAGRRGWARTSNMKELGTILCKEL